MRTKLSVIGILSAMLLSVPPTIAQAPLSATQERALRPKDTFKECDVCPQMVVVSAGVFTMGSPANERARIDNEGPLHEVTIPRRFAVGKYEVTVDQFAAFVDETGYDTGTVCDIWQDGKWSERPGYSWRNPPFPQNGSHPAACLSWDDAKAYLAWLSRKTGQDYRLPTEAEWEYAARAGSKATFHFGRNVRNYCRYGNGADQAARRQVPDATAWMVLSCNDGQAYTARVGSYAPNRFGLYDMLGNVFEWVEDCWNDGYTGAPSDGAAWTTGDCGVRVQRGGAWGYPPDYLRTAVRGQQAKGYRYINAGMRVVRTLAP